MTSHPTAAVAVVEVVLLKSLHNENRTIKKKREKNVENILITQHKGRKRKKIKKEGRKDRRQSKK